MIEKSVGDSITKLGHYIYIITGGNFFLTWGGDGLAGWCLKGLKVGNILT